MIVWSKEPLGGVRQLVGVPIEGKARGITWNGHLFEGKGRERT